MSARSTTSKSQPPGARKASRKSATASGKNGKNGKRSRRWVWVARGLVAAFFLGSAGLLGAVALFSYYSRDLPTVATLKHYNPPQISRVVDRHGRVISELFEERRTVVPIAKIPRVVVLSVLAAEDADFYRHRGLDYAGILRALFRDLTGQSMQGASTITQQIVKNVLLTPERTISRKVRELILARRLEQELSKDEILFLYLNHINFGHARYGVQEAARFYFGKDVSELDLAEASMLAGLPQAPSRLSPLRHPQAAKQRQLYVLTQLEHKRAQYWDDLPLEEIRAARERNVKLAGDTQVSNNAPEVSQLAAQLLDELVGPEAARRGGYVIETSIDLELQRKTRAALQHGLSALDTRHALLGPLQAPKRKLDRPARVAKLAAGKNYEAVVTSADDARGEIGLDIGGQRAVASLAELSRWNPNRLSASAFAQKGARVQATVESVGGNGQPARARLLLGPQGAVVVIDPRSRDVLALVGGDEAEFGFNRAVQAVRQPGSSWKALTYALAIDSGKYTPASLVLDAPEVFDEWKPDNYETWSYAGAVRLREAVAQSINLVAVRVLSDLTPKRVIDFARTLGITTELEPSLALALGASGVKPVELVNAYATFAAAGRYAPYRLVRSIKDGRGKKLPLPERAAPRAVMKPEAAYVLTSMLQSVVLEGTAKAAGRKLGRPAAGKTGTSNNARDAWFVGYTPEIVAGVWVGYDDHRPLGKGESGAKAALPIWMEVIQAALGDRPAVEFPVPNGIERVRIDPKSGLRAYEGMQDAIEEVFVTGTAPTQASLPPDVLDSGSFVMEQLGGVGPPPAPPN